MSSPKMSIHLQVIAVFGQKRGNLRDLALDNDDVTVELIKQGLDGGRVVRQLLAHSPDFLFDLGPDVTD